jgi:ribosome recycling factor
MIEQVLKDAEERMQKSVSTTNLELGKIRTGRANLSLLDSIRVNYYGSNVPLNQVANLGVPEPRMIIIQPWEKSMLAEIEKAILKADIGITPNNDGNIIRLPIPSLTEERRKDLVKVVHQVAEEGKVAIRNIRRDALDTLKNMEKEGKISEDEQYNGGIDIKELVEKYSKQIDDEVEAKEKEVLEI